MEIDNVLRGIYYDQSNPNSFSTATKLFKAGKEHIPTLTLNKVRDWLSGEFTYTLHKPIRRHFKRNPIIVENIDQQWEADLVDMQEFKRFNHGYNYILTVIDVLSKYAWAEPLRDKTGKSIVKAFINIFESGRKPFYLRTDQGKEFLNREFRQFLRENYVYHFTSNNKTVKCAIVERFNRTLKGRMFKYFTSKGKRVWYNILQDLIIAYNNSTHRSIKMTPIEATNTSSQILYNILYKGLDRSIKPRPNELISNDTIRKKYNLGPFDKSYYPNWTDQLYKIVKKYDEPVKPLYKIEDQGKHLVKGRYYQEEIQKVKENLYRIEKVIRKRTYKGVKQIYVKWVNYPDNYNSWIDEKELIKL